MMGLEERYRAGSQVVIIGKRLPDYTGEAGTVVRILANPEGIEILDQYIVCVKEQEVSFWPHELKPADPTS